MSYYARYINPQIEGGKIYYTLILVHSEGKFPTVRIDKKFPSDVSQEELANEAKKEIVNIFFNPELEINMPPRDE
jgi:hypothetical protein